jgi:hypothetical protein
LNSILHVILQTLQVFVQPVIEALINIDRQIWNREYHTTIKVVNQGHRPKHYELHDNDITIHDDSEIFIQQYRENVWVGKVLYSMKPTT